MFWLMFLELNFRIQLKAVPGRCPVQKTDGSYEFCLYCEVDSKKSGIKKPAALTPRVDVQGGISASE
ncbi:hypothetical protein ACMYSK_19645 [Klebsiella sp. I138]|uniref:hypothetical protein n=1 Tax=Klebsiella sp. I138 TaxID=2755385 RepID=UPI003DA7EB77